MFEGIVQPTHLILVLVVVLLVMGPKRLPEMGRSLGQSIREFKSGVAGSMEEPDEHPARRASVERGEENEVR